MRAIKRFGLGALVAGGVCLAASAAGLPAPYSNTPGAKEFPGADVLVLSESRAYTLSQDGRVTEHVRRVEKILTYQGMDEIGDPKIAFQKEDQDLRVTVCRTLTPDGRTVDAKANSFNEMTPFELEKAPAYTGWREMVVTKVGLDVNAVVELEYTLADKRPWRRFLEGVEVLRDAYPALVREVSVSLPQGVVLQHKVLNAQAAPAVRSEGGQTITTWTLKDVPAARLGGVSHDERAFLPALIFTTCPDWGAQSGAVGALVERAVAESSPALDKKADALTAGLSVPFEKVLKLHTFVAEDINTAEWSLSAFDFVPRGAAKTLDAGYGNALDKGVLLCALLKRAGIEAAIAAVRQVPDAAADATTVPCLAQMEGVLVRVDMGKTSSLWLDPTEPLAERSQRDFQGFKGLPLIRGYGEIHSMIPLGSADRLTASLELKVASDLSSEGKATVGLSGEYSRYFKTQGSKDAQKSLLEGFLSGIVPGATVVEFSVVRMEPGETAFEVAFKAAAPAKGSLKALALGLPEGSVLKGVRAIYLQDRDLPLLLPHGGEEKISLRFKLAEGLKAGYLPPALDLKTPAGSLHRAWTAKEDGLSLEWEARIPSALVSVRDYPSFRDLVGQAGAQAGQTVLFE